MIKKNEEGRTAFEHYRRCIRGNPSFYSLQRGGGFGA